MVWEYQRGAESPWKAYFDILPSHFDTLMFWSEQELRHLQGSAVVNKISKQGADRTFTETLLPIVQSNADAFRLQNAGASDILSLFHRMGSTIMAYAFDLEKPASAENASESGDGWEEDDEDGASLSKGMVPLADLLNADAHRNNAKLFYEDDRVVMKAVQPIAAGEEIFNDYGFLPTADILRRYGYVTGNYAAYDVVEISTDLIKETAIKQSGLSVAEINERAEYLDEQGVLDDAYDIFHQSDETERFPEELCIFVNGLTSSKDDFTTMKRKDKLPKPELTPRSSQLLRKALTQRLQLYPADADVVESAADDTSARRQNMAVQVIRGEKLLLQEALRSLADAPSMGSKRPIDALDHEHPQGDKRSRD